jgi:hypothetical protein
MRRVMAVPLFIMLLMFSGETTATFAPEKGFIVVSDQLPDLTEFEVFDRQTKHHLGAFYVTGVNNTDGIGSTQQPLPMYPLGLLAAVNNDHSVAGIGWAPILEATGISCAGKEGVNGARTDRPAD